MLHTPRYRIGTRAADGRPSVHVFAASYADQYLAWHLLRVCRFPLSWEGFQARQDMPGYLPQHRLLAAIDGQTVGHVRLMPRRIQFGHSVVPVCVLDELVVLPECAMCGVEEELVEHAAQAACGYGAVLIILRTQRWKNYLNRGWLPGPRSCSTTISPHALLAHLRRFPRPLPDWWDGPPPRRRAVRLCRRTELDVVRQLYATYHASHPPGSYGAVVRERDYWEWLLSKGACDRVNVAVEAWWSGDGSEQFQAVQGYMAAQNARIVELVAPAPSPALDALLTRAADDAVESDWYVLRFDAPPSSYVHTLLRGFGGITDHLDVDEGWTTLVRLSSLAQWVEAIGAELRARIAAHRHSGTLELGLEIDGEGYLLRITADELAWLPGNGCRHTISLSYWDAVGMILGRTSADALIEQQKLRGTSAAAYARARWLFPEVPWWLNVWDDLPSCH